MKIRNMVMTTLLSAATAQFAYSGIITLEGFEKIGHPVEFIKIRADISSSCYPSADEVTRVTNEASVKIKEIMHNHMDTSEAGLDTLTSYPGTTHRKTITRYDSEKRREVVVCENAWHAQNTVTLKLADKDKWLDLQIEVLRVIDAYIKNERDSSTINISLHQPVPQLYPETTSRLKKEADEQAILNATKRLEPIKAQCKLTHTTLTNMKERQEANHPTNRMKRGSGGEDSGGFELDYGLLYVTSTWKLTWEFVDANEGAEDFSADGECSQR